ncbi:hypothetical protein FHU33_4644 [Blastococcus colisei]|uniref:Uncharacterized protein n=1 Tax=Blastococcus colisei TaxID=1564162 RepID=A0A543P1K1_9ACTN|nr:hypothetical protein [Blastococcus colisei]TQN37967.1 hypothetical protein FHU33_4644 [Blastococcus colisei]
MQLAYRDGGVESLYDDGSNYDVISGCTVLPTTGISDSASPTTSRFYCHSASHNTFTARNVYGVRQVIGCYGGSSFKRFVGISADWRETEKAALDLAEPCGS